MINVDYFVEVLKLMNAYDMHEPVFSLDPYDPYDLGGEFQKKRFLPDIMTNTPVGEVLFQADYFLKKFSFGD